MDHLLTVAENLALASVAKAEYENSLLVVPQTDAERKKRTALLNLYVFANANCTRIEAESMENIAGQLLTSNVRTLVPGISINLSRNNLLVVRVWCCEVMKEFLPFRCVVVVL